MKGKGEKRGGKAKIVKYLPQFRHFIIIFFFRGGGGGKKLIKQIIYRNSVCFNII